MVYLTQTVSLLKRHGMLKQSTQEVQVRPSGHESPIEFKNSFWMNFTQTLIWKLKILGLFWLVPIYTSLITPWGLEIWAKRLNIVRSKILKTSYSLDGLLEKKNYYHTIHNLSIKDLDLCIVGWRPKSLRRDQMIYQGVIESCCVADVDQIVGTKEQGRKCRDISAIYRRNIVYRRVSTRYFMEKYRSGDISGFVARNRRFFSDISRGQHGSTKVRPTTMPVNALQCACYNASTFVCCWEDLNPKNIKII